MISFLHVAANNDRTPASLDHDHLRPACVERREDEPEPVKPSDLVVELQPLDVERPAREDVVATTFVEVQVCVDNDVNANKVEVMLSVHCTLCCGLLP